MDGNGVPRNTGVGLQLIRAAADKGHPKAREELRRRTGKGRSSPAGPRPPALEDEEDEDSCGGN